MRNIEKEELKEILEKHLKFTKSEEGGECADLSVADLSCADLRSSNLSGADLSGADLKNILYDEYTTFFAMCCPEEGAFVGFKRCRNNLIVKLLITEDAKRNSSTTRKCRCSKAKVLEILTTEGKKAVERKAVSIKDGNFVYKVGKTVFVKNFCEDRWKECAAGIHFFLTFDEAVKYNG